MVGKAKKHPFSSNLLLPPAMKDFASCFSEHAVKVSDTSCSGSSSSGNSSVLDSGSSVLSAVTCLYRARLSTGKELLVRVTWSKASFNPVLSIGVDEDPSIHRRKPNATSGQLLRKKKGTRSYTSGNCAVALHWDVSSAKYQTAPEPVDGFYVVIVVNSEIALLLGDLSADFVSRFEEVLPVAEFAMINRKEQVLGHTLHSTRARFCESGVDHEITIRCRGEGWDAKDDSELSVSVDKKRVVHVRSLKWNFRGNQTIFIDGSPVDMMWDVHDWWFRGAPAGYAVFMFRARSSLESRLWLEEEVVHTEQGTSGFSLLIQAFKS
ncbi:hypothetical protein Cni_G10989 [Canna indica]|uniref:DUF868 domain-containing protein n=1 Tax=Canna indica TaxID=4628 RepID=A0AAQ3K765_9LILI|nr:hypothetical protein Cni_G10989 [Canna indica]